MESNIFEALKLMIIGMGTVFVSLILIIQFGKLLIGVINKFFPEEEKPVAQATVASNAIDPQIAQAINMAISNLMGGKGKVEKIEKI